MKKSKFTEQQIIFELRQAENGVKVEEVCRKMGISDATFYNWKKKFGGLGVDEQQHYRSMWNAQLRAISPSNSGENF